MRFFPRQTVILTAEDSLARRFAHSLGGTAIITGVLVCGFRWLVFRPGTSHSLLLLLFGILGQLAILLGGATVHLGSHPVHQWRWRAPAFALVESATAILMSGVLIALRAEVIGAERAHWSDWPWLAMRIFIWHGITLLLFAVILGTVVQVVRYGMLRHDHRDSTARAIHEDHLKQETAV
jgi:hypothetical protein